VNELVDKEIKASLFSFYMIAITRALHYVSSLILLFLLTPQDFGIMAIVMSVVAIMNSLSSFGVDSALISYSGDETMLSDDAWTLELIKGVILAVLIVVLSPVIASWLSEPILEPILAFMCLGFLLQSSKNIGLVSLRKELNFVVIFKCEIGMAVVSFLLTLFLAFYFRSPWAIACGYIGGWIAYFFLSYFLCSYRPRISFNRAGMSSLLGYSKWILLSGQINTLVEHGINLLIGSHFGMAILGQFERANMFTRKTAMQIGEVIWKVGLPSLSARSCDINKLRDQYLLMFSYICLLVFPLMILVNIYIPVLAELAEPRDWQQFNKLMVALGITAAVTMLITPGSILFQALRQPRIGFNVATMRLVSILIFIFPCVQFFGLIGVAFTLSLAVCVALPYSFYKVKRLINVSFSEHLYVCIKHLIPCVVFLTVTPGDAPIVREIINLVIALVGYFLLLYILSKDFRAMVKYLIRSFKGDKIIEQ